MKTIGRVSLMLAALAVFNPPQDKERLLKEEFAKIEGEWKQVSGIANGEELPSDLFDGLRVTIKGNKKTVEHGGRVIVRDVTIVLDPGASPKIWDEEPKSDAKPKLVIRGIYKLEGDKLTRCIAAANDDRPTSFESRPGSGHTLQVFRKIKPGDAK